MRTIPEPAAPGFARRPRRLVALVALFACICTPAVRGAPYPLPPPDLPTSLPQVHLILTEISWDFGDVEPFDWRKELTSSDPTASFRLRWRYSGPGFDNAVLAVFDANGTAAGEVALPLGPVFADGFRYTDVTIGSLPATPTLTLGVLLKDSAGSSLGSLSNTVQISAETPADPFLYVPLGILGIRQDTAVPGLTGALWCGPTRDEHVWSTGVRRFTGGVGPVTSNDRWHIGSNTKAFTSTVIGRLIQDGTPLPAPSTENLQWNTPISRIFPEWAADIHERFDQTTIRHLACHRSGLRMTGAEDHDTRQLGPGTLNADPTAGRRQMTRRLLIRQHKEEDDTITQPGDRWFYGSGNYLILGAVIEQLTGQRYEAAMQTLLFAPLGITTAGFGMPAVDVSNYQPHGHRGEVAFPHNVVVDNYALEPVWNPAGGIYLSLADWLKFCRLHIDGTEGTLTFHPTTLANLHTPHPREFAGDPPEGIDDPNYAWGWGVFTHPETGGVFLSHDGTYFRFYARHQVFLSDGFAVVTAANIGPAYGYGDRAVNLLSNYLVEKTIGKILDPDTLAGTIAGGSRGSRGIIVPPERADDDRYDLYTLLPPAPPPFTLGDFYMLAPLAANRAYSRALGAWIRSPEILALEPRTTGPWQLRFASEEGLLYFLYRNRTLQPDGWTEAREVTGEEGETTIEVTPTAGLDAEFLQIRDYLP